MLLFFFFFKQKTAYEMRISDWSSDVCYSDLVRGCSGAGLAFAVDDELERGELAQAHGAAGVELLGRYADLGAEAELLAVDEAGGGVHDDGGGVDLAGEALCGSPVGGDERLAVAGDRKSGVEGESESVRVELGGQRLHKKIKI